MTPLLEDCIAKSCCTIQSHAKENLQRSGEHCRLLSFYTIHEQVKTIVRQQTNDGQVPQLTCNHNLPFAVAVNEQAGMPEPKQ